MEEAEALTGCGWTPLTPSLTATGPALRQTSGPRSGEVLRARVPRVVGNMLMSMLNTYTHDSYVRCDVFYVAPGLLHAAAAAAHSDRPAWEQQGDCVKPRAPVMIRQQNVYSRVKLHFDQFSRRHHPPHPFTLPPPTSTSTPLSLAAAEMLELCVCVVV